MKCVVIFSVLCLAVVVYQGEAKFSPPQVQVYTRHPVEDEKENVLLCLVKNFHPPGIDINLLVNGEKQQDISKTDLSFESDWKFKLLAFKKMQLKKGNNYACEVVHSGQTKKVGLEM
ncbi:beta-2-microglobulin-like [Latimeria chalumnae]|uniref:beta-2-microglobulin-like n=1 Tax=Latimeria chalumnae TaxID=7897 RepID=UPI00313E13E9